MTVEYVRAVAALAFLLALLVGGVALVHRSRWLERSRAYLKLPPQRLVVTSRVALGTSASLAIVRDGAQEHLLLIGDGRLLSTRHVDEESAA